jgi:cell shape-determining protein MreC
MAMDVVNIGEDKFQAELVFEGSPKLESQPSSSNTNPWQSPPLGTSQQSSGQTFIYDDQARISIQITLGHPFGSTSVNQVVGFHSPIHPGPKDELKITAGIVDEWGMPVQMDTLEIWLDPDGKNGGEAPYKLPKNVATTQWSTGTVGVSGPNQCWIAGTQTGSMCEAVINLSNIPKPPLDDDEQRMISYMIIGGDSVSGSKFDSGWRSLTVGNLTGAKYIAFSVGQGDMRNAVDILYAGHSPDYMNYSGAELDDDPDKGCSFKTEYFGHKNIFGQISKGASIRRPVCKHPPDVSLLQAGIERNWTAHFYNSKDWAPEVPWYFDVITENFNRFNFWYTVEPALGGEAMLWNCYRLFTEPWEYDPSTGFIIGVDESLSLPFDVRMLIHQTPWRDCAGSGSVSVDEYVKSNPVTIHELGHTPFGLADMYCCDGGYYQSHPYPNLYSQQYTTDNVSFSGTQWEHSHHQPGCSDAPVLGAPGDPFPAAHPGPLCPSGYASSGDVGLYPSIVIGSDGLGLVSYFDRTVGVNAERHNLKVAHCSNAECTSAITSSIDTEGNVGQYTSIAIGSDGLGLISYWEYKTKKIPAGTTVRDGDLKVAHCSNAECTSATISSIDKTGNVGQYTSITIGSDGLGLISYFDESKADLKVAHCSNVDCTSVTLTSIDTVGKVGLYTSIATGFDGLGLISYYDDSNDDLKVAHCSNAECTSATISSIDKTGNVGQYTSITIGSDGLGLISYYDDSNDDLKVAHCLNMACTSATKNSIVTVGDVGLYTSIAIPAPKGTGNGLGLISYRDATNRAIKLAQCLNVACTSATTSTVDITGLDHYRDVGAWTSIAVCSEDLGPNPGVITLTQICSEDLPLISYHDEISTAEGDMDGHNLAVARCSNDSCTTVSSSVLDKSGLSYWFAQGLLGELPLIESDDLTQDWYLPEPRKSLMGNYDFKITLANGEAVLVQAGPQSRARIEWHISRCQASRC